MKREQPKKLRKDMTAVTMGRPSPLPRSASSRAVLEGVFNDIDPGAGSTRHAWQRVRASPILVIPKHALGKGPNSEGDMGLLRTPYDAHARPYP